MKRKTKTKLVVLASILMAVAILVIMILSFGPSSPALLEPAPPEHTPVAETSTPNTPEK